MKFRVRAFVRDLKKQRAGPFLRIDELPTSSTAAPSSQHSLQRADDATATAQHISPPGDVTTNSHGMSTSRIQAQYRDANEHEDVTQETSETDGTTTAQTTTMQSIKNWKFRFY